MELFSTICYAVCTIKKVEKVETHYFIPISERDRRHLRPARQAEVPCTPASRLDLEEISARSKQDD